MPKHRWHETFKSFWGNHIDPKKDEELRATKAEIDGKVEKIMKFLKGEDDNDRKEPIANLIEDIHNYYQSLYANYDNLTEELRKKAHGKKHGKDSSSSSSDSSDSDDFPRAKSKEHDKVENNFENDTAEEKSKLLTENADLNIESARKLQAELNQKLEDMNRERESLISAKEAAFISIEEEKRNVGELRTMNSQLQHEKDDLQLELEARNQQLSTLKENLGSRIAEQQNILEEKENLVLQVKDLNLELNSVSNLKRELEEQLRSKSEEFSQLQEENTKLQIRSSEMERVQKKYEDGESEASAQIMALTADVNSLKVQLDSLGAQNSEADIIIEKKSGEISEILIQIEKLKQDLSSKLGDENQLREEKGGLENKISEIEKALAERGEEVIAIQKKMDDVQNGASTQIAALTEQVNSSLQQLELLQSEKSQLEVQIGRAKQESTENLAQAENQHTELANKIVEQERKLKEQDDAFKNLSEEHKQLEGQLQKCKECLKSSEKKIEEMTEQFHEDIAEKNQEIDQLEESIEDLKRELEMKADEMGTLVENMRTIEVKQRLTSQKLRITEQVLGETEESHQKKVEKLLEEQRLLEERISTLSGIIAAYKEAQVKMATEISEKVNDTMMGIDTFGVKFEEDYGHLESRIYEIANELKVTINWITRNYAEQDQLKNEIAGLLRQLKDVKEQELLLTVKIRELETMLREDEDQRKSLIQTVKQQEEKMRELEKMIVERDEKMGELERKMNEKDNGILSLGEEKREAIRQLCIWIDYNHNRYADLKDLILKTRGRRRQTAA